MILAFISKDHIFVGTTSSHKRKEVHKNKIKIEFIFERSIFVKLGAFVI